MSQAAPPSANGAGRSFTQAAGRWRMFEDIALSAMATLTNLAERTAANEILTDAEKLDQVRVLSPFRRFRSTPCFSRIFAYLREEPP